jgi:hypothetical protein
MAPRWRTLLAIRRLRRISVAISWDVRVDGSVGSALLQFGARLAAGDNRLYALDMSESHLRSMPPIADDMLRTDFRLMVRASKPGSKLFVWTILREDQDCIPIMQSSTTFRSLEDAHVAGSVALDKFRTHRALSAKRRLPTLRGY